MDILSKPVPFYASRSDTLGLLQGLEESTPVKYTLAGTFDQPEVVAFEEAAAIPSLGISLTGNQTLDPTFLISLRNEVIHVRGIPQRRGGIRYGVDQRENPRAIGLAPGGLYLDAVIIAGQLGTTTGEPESDILLKEIKRRMRNWTRVRSYLVAPEALRLLDRGYRLTPNVRMQTEYDLKRL